jgi:hypothetical protein
MMDNDLVYQAGTAALRRRKWSAEKKKLIAMESRHT